jgi:hypothetical protein
MSSKHRGEVKAKEVESAKSKSIKLVDDDADDGLGRGYGRRWEYEDIHFCSCLLYKVCLHDWLKYGSGSFLWTKDLRARKGIVW